MTGPENRRLHVFFYGLFMDADALRSQGIFPTTVEHAQLHGFALRIGQRATLAPNPGSIVHGILMDLSPADLKHLYSGPGLEDYSPEAVLVTLSEGTTVPALCYNLEHPTLISETNPAYVAKLRSLGQRLGLPRTYIDSIH